MLSSRIQLLRPTKHVVRFASSTTEGSATKSAWGTSLWQEDLREQLVTQKLMSERNWLEIPSQFPGRPNTVLCTAPPEVTDIHEARKDALKVSLRERVTQKSPTFRLLNNASAYPSLRATLLYSGFRRSESEQSNYSWGRHLTLDGYRKLNSLQKVNHFPYTWELGRKDSMAQNLRKMLDKHGPESYGFFPETYVLPKERSLLKTAFKKGDIFIIKPPNSSCGKGIRLVDDIEQIPSDVKYIAQRYIGQPHLIDGYKYDLRLYVLVTGFDPLKVYLFPDGLVRFATHKYEESTGLSDRYKHLTNYSVNKFSDTFVKNKDAGSDDTGSKWSLQALKRYLSTEVNAQLWPRVEDVITKTLIGVENHITPRLPLCVSGRNVCHELFGFDILIDQDLKPWLIEVNLMPSLGATSPLDAKIKTLVLQDMFNTAGFRVFDREELPGDARPFGSYPLPPQATIFSDNMTLSKCDLSTQSSMSKLTDTALDIICDSEDELARCGNFKRIYPVKETVHQYASFFENTRPSNALLANWEQSKSKSMQELLSRVESMKPADERGAPGAALTTN